MRTIDNNYFCCHNEMELIKAAAEGNLDNCKLILAERSVRNISKYFMGAALNVALATEHTEIVELLADYGATIAGGDLTSILHASLICDIHIVRKLLATPITIDSLKKAEELTTSMIIAKMVDDPYTIENINMIVGKDPPGRLSKNRRDALVNFAMGTIESTMDNYVEHIITLLSGCDCNNDDIHDIMNILIKKNNLRFIKILIQKGFGIDRYHSKSRTTILMTAVEWYDIDIVKYLIDDCKANVNCFDGKKQSALTIALGSSLGHRKEIIDILLSNGANITGYEVRPHRSIDEVFSEPE